MLRLDLARLSREGSVSVEARIPGDDASWEGHEVQFDGDVHVRLRATHAGTGEVVVRGSIDAPLKQECRRCLEPVVRVLSEDVTMVFTPADAPGAEEDGEVRLFEADAAELDLSGPVREELILSVDPYVVCDPECKGLCPQCGTNRNVETCSCVQEEQDPRWDALRALKEE